MVRMPSGLTIGPKSTSLRPQPLSWVIQRKNSVVVALREVGADADAVLAAQVDDVLDGLDVVVDGRRRAPLQERREHGDADEAVAVGDEAQLLVALVARMRLQARRQAVRVGDPLLGGEDGVLAGLGADVGEVAQDAEPVHLGQHVAAEVGEAAVALLVAAGADEVLGVVGELDDAQAELVEEREVVEAVLDAARVLPAEDDAGLALPLGALRCRRWCRPG